MGDQLSALANDAPVTALKAVSALERMSKNISRLAAGYARAVELSTESIGKALGLSEQEAGSEEEAGSRLLLRYSLRH